MSAYFAYQVQLPDAPFVRHKLLEWHPKFKDILAVGSCDERGDGGEINLFDDEGDKVKGWNNSLKKPTAKPLQLAWHPTKKILAVAWSSGLINVWNCAKDKDEIYVIAGAVDVEINNVQWSSQGSKLLVTDRAGDVFLHKIDVKGRPVDNGITKTKLKEPISCVLLKPPFDVHKDSSNTVPSDDALNEFRTKRTVIAPAESSTFFIGGETGGIYFVKENGQVNEMFTLNKCVIFLSFSARNNILICISNDLMLSRHQISSSASAEAKELSKVKINAKLEKLNILPVRDNVLAISCGELSVRILDIEHEENILLALTADKGYSGSDSINCMAYCSTSGIVAAGTQLGKLALWKPKSHDQSYTLTSASAFQHSISSIQWSCGFNCLSAQVMNDIFVLKEQSLLTQFAENIDIFFSHVVGLPATVNLRKKMPMKHLVVQSDQHTLQLTRLEPSATVEFKMTDHPPKALRIWSPFVACFDGGRFSVYELTDSMDGGILVVGSFDLGVGQQQSNRELKLSLDEDDLHNESGPLADFALHSSGLYLTDKTRIQVKTFQGTLKQSLPLADEENDPCLLNVQGHFLVAATTSGFLRIYDLSRREAKSICNTKFAAENIAHFAAFATLKMNCNGTKISFTVKKIDDTLDQSLYAWDVDNDHILEYNFQESMPELYAKDHFWDLEDPRYLVVEAAAYTTEEINDCSTIATFFVTNDSSILLHDSFKMSSICDRLIGLAVPFMYFLKTKILIKVDPWLSKFFRHFFEFHYRQLSAHLPDHFVPMNTKACSGYCNVAQLFGSTGDCTSIDGSSTNNQASMLEMNDLERLLTKHVVRRTCRDFVGLEDMNKEMKAAMLDFSYHLTVGNMDEAFKAVKLIKSESVWENMAQMCVKTGRLDVAAICLGNMGNARAARNLRKGLMNQNPNCLPESAKNEILGRLAVDLGMKEDAFRIYSTSSNPHLVNKLCQARNDWKKAISIAETEDRIHLRNTFNEYARCLESVGSIEEAMKYYEKAETHSYNVPIMLINNIEALRLYVDQTKDKKLYKWWAQYCESLEELEQAKKYYNLAKDYLSIVRLLCFTGEISEATKVANESNDKAACYHLARQCENKGQFKEAVHFFTKACAYGSAIRLCKEHGMYERIAQLALLGADSDMIEAAKFYENRPGHADKAVMLFHKVGMYGRALDLAFRTEQFSALDLIVADLNEKSDPRVLERCAEFFVQNQQYTKAVQFLGYAKKFNEAIELCAKKNVPITDDFAELLTPTKDDIPDTAARSKTLERLAEICTSQSLYHYAAKKYTQAGNKIQAMKALLKSGDTSKIIFFANTARQKEIYLMAGNYLQSLDWKNDAEVMKNIVHFYTKGQAPQSLCGFYDACAQLEIDEYKDYDKALVALQEAAKCLAKSKSEKLDDQSISLNKRIDTTKRFLNIRRIYDTDPVEAVNQLQQMTQEADVDSAVRLGDLYSVLIIHNVKKDNYKKALSYLQELKKREPKLDLSKYLKKQLIEKIYGKTETKFDDENVVVAAKSSSNLETNSGSLEATTVPESRVLQRRKYNDLDDF